MSTRYVKIILEEDVNKIKRIKFLKKWNMLEKTICIVSKWQQSKLCKKYEYIITNT